MEKETRPGREIRRSFVVGYLHLFGSRSGAFFRGFGRFHFTGGLRSRRTIETRDVKYQEKVQDNRDGDGYHFPGFEDRND